MHPNSNGARGPGYGLLSAWRLGGRKPQRQKQAILQETQMGRLDLRSNIIIITIIGIIIIIIIIITVKIIRIVIIIIIR